MRILEAGIPAAVQVWIADASLAFGWLEFGQASERGALGPGVEEAEKETKISI